MKSNFSRRYRRSKPSRAEGNFFRKESLHEQSFFGGAAQENFFQPASTIQRKCEKCEDEDKKAQRKEDMKEDEKQVMRAEDKKEEEKIQRQPEKKEEEKVQRQPEKKEEEKIMKVEDKKEEEKLQKKEAGVQQGSSAKTSNYIGSLNGKGKSLPAKANYFFSSRIGYDFSNVKIHTDKEASESAKELNAKAYTIGNNIVFNEGRFDAESEEGKKLLAHELTHVVQQQKGLKTTLQRIACEEGAKAPPRVEQPKENKIDPRAQAIIDIASGKDSASVKAVSIVTQIICKYYPSDAGLVDSVVHKGSLKGLDTTSKGSGESTTGIVGVGDYFVENTTATHFARRVLQVGHELQHIKQYREGMAGKKNSDEREFLAFTENALADEFEGTGRMTFSTRLSIIDGALGYYHCLSTELKEKYESKLKDLQARRKTVVDSGRVKEPGTEPTSCVRSSN